MISINKSRTDIAVYLNDGQNSLADAPEKKNRDAKRFLKGRNDNIYKRYSKAWR
jgi:hypothetical protein